MWLIYTGMEGGGRRGAGGKEGGERRRKVGGERMREEGDEWRREEGGEKRREDVR